MLDVTYSGAIFASDGFDPANHFDTSGILGLSLEYEAELLALSDLGNAYYTIFDSDPTFSALTGELTVTYGSTASNAFVIEGDGLTPDVYSTFEDFMTALENGLATGAFETLRVYMGGAEVLTLGMTETGFSFSSGDVYTNFQGSLPTQTQDVFDFIGAAAELIRGFESLSESAIESLFTVIGDYSISEFVLGEGDAALMSIALTDTSLVVSMGGAQLTAIGTFPGTTISEALTFYNALMTALGDEAVSMSELTDLSVTSVSLVDMNGDDLLSAEGDFSGIEVDGEGEVDETTLTIPSVTIEGSDDPDEEDDLFDSVFLDSEATSVQVNLNDGDDNFEIDGALRNAFSGSLAPITVDGGDGFDQLEVEEYANHSDHVEVDWEFNSVVAIDGDDNVNYEVTFENFERVLIDLSGSSADVIGDGDDNRVRVVSLGGFFEFDGQEGWDRLEMHRTNNGDDAPRGFTLTEFKAAFDFELQDDGGIAIFNKDDPTQIGVLHDVEEIRLLEFDDTASRDDWNTRDYSVTELLDLEDFTGTPFDGTEDDDEIVGNALDNTINGYGGDDEIWGNGGTDTISGGDGDDRIHVEAGELHELDGGEGWDAVTLHNDTDSAMVIIDMDAGHIKGFPSLDENDTPIYHISLTGFEGVNAEVSGHLYVTLTEDANYFNLRNFPSYFEVQGSVSDHDTVSFAWGDLIDGDEHGVTLAEMRELFDFQLIDNDPTQFELISKTEDGNPVVARIYGVEYFDFQNDDRTDNEWVSLSELLQLVDITGTDGDDRLVGNSQDNNIQGLEGDDEIYVQGGDDTVDAGPGEDAIHMEPGNHVIDGGTAGESDWDHLRITDFSSEAVNIDYESGTIKGMTGLTGDDTVYYTTTFTGIEGLNLNISGDVEIHADPDSEDGIYFEMTVLPNTLTVFGSSEEHDEISFRWIDLPDTDEEHGYTRAEFLEEFYVERNDDDHSHYQIFKVDDDSVWADLYDVDRLNFWADRESEERDEVALSELAGVTDIHGDENDNNLEGNSLDNTIFGYEGDDRIQSYDGDNTVDAGPGDDSVHLSTGNHDVDGGDGWDFIRLVDYDSAIFEVDFEAGTIKGYAEGSDTPSYTSTVANFEGAMSYNSGEVYVTSNVPDIWFGFGKIPSYFSIDNGDGDGKLSFRWTENDDDSTGTTLSDIEDVYEIVALDPTNKNFDVYLLDGGTRTDKVGEIRGISEIQFYNPDSDDTRVTFSLSSLATYDSEILGSNNVDDTLDGTDGYDVIDGLSGDDLMQGGDGPDALYSDTYFTEGGTAGNDTLDGGQGDDVYHVEGLAEEIVTIRDSGGEDTLVLYYYPGVWSSEFVWDGSSATQLSTNGHQIEIEADGDAPAIENIQMLGLSNEGDFQYQQTLSLVVDQDDFTELGVVFAGSNDADTISAPDLDASSEDAYYGEIFGNGGDDLITVFPQFTYAMYGGDGNDTITVEGGDGVHVETDSSNEDPASQYVYAGIGDDVITTNDGDDYLGGDEGNDTLDAGLGSDSVSGGDGNDLYIHGSSGQDADTFDGGDGVDTFYADLSSVDADAFELEIDLSSDEEGNAGSVGNIEGRDTLIDVENLEIDGSVDMDIIGSDADNDIKTGSGSDTILVEKGENTIDSGAGDDAIGVGRTDNTVDGGEGDDILAIIDEESEVLVVDMSTGEASGQSDLSDAPEVYFTTEFSNIEDVRWNNTQTVKLIGTGGSDEFAPMVAPAMLIIDNGDGDGILDFTQFINDDESLGLNADELIVYTIRPIDATDRNYKIFIDVDGDEVQVAELYGISQTRFLNALDETEVITHPISTYAQPFQLLVEGIPTEDQTLSVDGSLTGFTEPLTYQWTRDGDDIDGATGSTYTLGQDDVGFEIAVVVTGSGSDEEETALATSAVSNINDETTGVPTITGTPEQGETLTASIADIEDEDGIPDEVNYQWKRGGEDIDGATGATYDLTADDIGSVISVTVSFTDDHGDDVSLDSDTTDEVEIDPNAELCDIDMGSHYEAYLANQTVTDKDVDGNPTFLSVYISDYVERDGPVSGADAADYTLMADADPLEVSGTQEFNIRAFGTATNNAGYGIVLQDFENDATGHEDYGSGNFAGTASVGVYTAENNTSHDSGTGTNTAGDQYGLLTVTDVMSVHLFETGNAAAANPSNGDDPGIATHEGNDADRGFNKTAVIYDHDVAQYLEALPGEDDNGGVLVCFDQGTTVFGFAMNFLGRQDDKRPVYLDIHFSDGSVYRTLTDSDGHQEGGEQYFSYLIDPDESDLSIMAFVLYEPYDSDDHNAGDRDIFAIDDLALVVDPDGDDETIDDLTILTSDEYVSTLNINTAPTGDVSITGDAEQGGTLTADTSAIEDSDGLDGATFTYQWQRDGEDVDGATGETYDLTEEDVGSVMTVVVSYVDDAGHDEELSAQSSEIANVNDDPTGGVTITGTAEEGETLTAVSTLDDIDGMGTLHYQWLRDGEPIPDAIDDEYELDQADVGAEISVTVSYEDGHGTDESATSDATDPVTNTNDDPTGVLLILGTPEEGETLTAFTSALKDDDGVGDLSYQWLRDGSDIPGAESETYQLTADDVGEPISLRVSFTDGFGNVETFTSDATDDVENVNDAVAGHVTVTGNATEGETLTADASGLSDADGMEDAEPAYQWLRDGDPIDGATADTYDLTGDDVGAAISVEVSFEDDHGSAESATSAATDPVANVNDDPTGVVLISGTNSEGETLTANAAGLDDADGLGDFSFQWLRDGDPIEGATGSAYNLVQADVGTVISVTVSFTDGHGTDESVTSDPTNPVTNVNTSPTGSVLITGSAQEDETLTADTAGLADADGLGAFSYQWLRDGAPVDGETGATYDVTAADADAAISVEVSYTDGEGTTESVTSDETDPVEAFVIEGTDGDDDLAGNSLDNEVNGNDGDDTMTGEEGDDTLDGGAGSDDLDGGEGDDEYHVDGTTESVDTISDSAGDDTLVIYNYPGLDSSTFVWNGTTATRTTTYGHSTIINALAGIPVIENIRWVDLDSDGDETGSRTLDLVVDQADFTSQEVVFAGSDDDDTITAPDVAADGSANWGEIFGNGGDDTITLSTIFNHFVYAGSGDDVIVEGEEGTRDSSSINNLIQGQEGDDDITMGGGDDTVLGGDGDDTVRDGAGDDSVDGGEDNDQFFYTSGDSDDYDGGRGYDFIDVDLSAGGVASFTIDLDAGEMGETGSMTDSLNSIEGVRVIGDVDTTVVGDSGSNTIDLDEGDDSVDAGGGNDAVYAGDGDDTVNGEDGDDFIEGDLGTNVIDGGDGTDTALYAGAYDDYSIVVDGSGFDVTGTDVSDDVDNVEIFSFSDQVFTAGMIRIGATNGGDEVGDGDSTDSQELSSGGGDDSVTGGAGSDTVDAGADNDTVDGGAGADTIDGGSGDDSVGGGNGDDEIFDGLGNDTIGGGEGSDTGIALSGNNSFVEDDEATDSADTSMDDYYAGGYGDDEFFGGGGNDVLVGDRGSAFYFGDDTMTGGTGDDILQGSGGADVFIFRSGDGDDTIGTVDLRTVGSATDITDVLITGADFEVGLDRVDLTDFGFASAADVLALLTDSGGNAVLTTADGTITFYDIQSADLGADDFII